MGSRLGNGGNRSGGAELRGGVGLPGSGARNDLLGGTETKPVEPKEEAAPLPPPARFMDLPTVLDQLQLVLGEMEDQNLISHRESNALQLGRGSFASIAEVAAFAEELALKLQSAGKEHSGLTEFVEKYGGLRGLRLSYEDFLKNIDSSAVVARTTLVSFELISNAPGEYKSGAHYIFCGMRNPAHEGPLLMHIHGRREDERVHLAREPLTPQDIRAVRVLGPVTSKTLIDKVEAQLLGS